ncbi:NAD(P)/FAD-dependent oxidoreductase [Salinicola aestuarinus]|uniref:NAD(P)/FAD-dependent oxidoreductase n=1 Tax=Salinicola aestuarinus TaxID=1949082 RepID=UPI000DA13FC6|nr:FAD-binding oxidoreductase [Salinicola aestuarinus]
MSTLSSGPARSYYGASANATPERETLAGETTADVCVIGGGFTGVSSALHLAERGYRVVLLESMQIGFGASGRNGGQIVNSYSRDMDVIADKYGEKTAEALGSMAFEGNRIIRERINTYGIDCDLKDGNLFAACTDKQYQGLIEHQALWSRYGHGELELMEGDAYRREIGSDRYVGALLDHAGGHLHPLNLVLGEAAALEGLGGRIYERSPVTQIIHGDPVEICTPSGKVRAKRVVVAGNAYQKGLLPALEGKSLPCGTQVVATAPLEAATARALLPFDRCVEDCNYLLDYYRLSADRRLIYGGGVNYGGRSPADIEGAIRPHLEATFPALRGVAIDYAWSGNFLLTLNRLPQFGRLNHNIYYAQGYSGHGVTATHLAGRLVAEALSGDAERFDAFADVPHAPFPGGRLFRVPATALGAWYYGLRDRLGW